MPIRVDTNACPVVIEDMPYRAARRTGMMPTLLVANPFLRGNGRRLMRRRHSLPANRPSHEVDAAARPHNAARRRQS
ncbi:hypothetical protein [Paraburkholderia xenovorans]|jgi:uncharacterized protein YaiI (UPF0178 family)